MFNFVISTSILLSFLLLVQVTTSEKVNLSCQGLPSNAKFESSQQIFNFYGSSCKEKCVVPNGYNVTSKYGAYKIHKTLKSWNEARKTCVAEGTQLGVFTTVDEIHLIERALPQNGVPRVWVGYHDLFQEGDWTTVWDKPIGSQSGIAVSWWPNQPDNYKGVQHCGVLDVNGMDDLECSPKLPFICKFTPKDCDFS